MDMKHASLLALAFPNINSLNHLQVLYLRPPPADTHYYSTGLLTQSYGEPGWLITCF